jgi:hypothetical protein
MSMRATRRRSEGGYVLAMVLIFVALLATVSVLLFTSVQFGATSTHAMEEKNGTLDAAEAGLNAALDALDISLAATSGNSETLPNGYRYTYTIYPNFAGSNPTSITDPLGSGGQVSVPAFGAVIVSTGTGPDGERPSTVEAAVSVTSSPLVYPHDAVVAGMDIQGSYNAAAGVTDQAGKNSAGFAANGNITSSISGPFQGSAQAGGTTNTLPPGTTNASQIALPTVSQFDYLVANYKNQAQLYPVNNVYQAGGTQLSSSYTCPVLNATSPCVLFYDGPLNLSANRVALTGYWTMVVNGDYVESGGAVLTFKSAPSLLIVNGNAELSASSLTAYLQAKGDTTISGNASFTGAVMTLGSITMTGGGGNAGFVYDQSVIPPNQSAGGMVKVITYAEY